MIPSSVSQTEGEKEAGLGEPLRTDDELAGVAMQGGVNRMRCWWARAALPAVAIGKRAGAARAAFHSGGDRSKTKSGIESRGIEDGIGDEGDDAGGAGMAQSGPASPRQGGRGDVLKIDCC